MRGQLSPLLSRACRVWSSIIRPGATSRSVTKAETSAHAEFSTARPTDQLSRILLKHH